MFSGSDFSGPSISFTSQGAQMATSPQYLPGYLLGEPSISTTPAQTKNLSVLTNSPWTNQSFSSPPPNSFSRNPVMEKQGGPPIHSLFDQQNESASTLKTVPNRNSSMGYTFTSPIKSRDSSLLVTSKSMLSQNNSFMSPAQIDPFYTQGEALTHDDELDETWVTVFGFPPAAVSYILQQFSQYGNVLQHKMNGGNNWIHLHYQSKIQAKKALSKNGKIFSGNMMIGVSPCIDKKVMMESAKENVFCESPLSFAPNKSSLNASGSNSLSGIRPLTQAYKVAASSNEVVPSSPTLQKKSNAVTKAMEYVLGW